MTSSLRKDVGWDLGVDRGVLPNVVVTHAGLVMVLPGTGECFPLLTYADLVTQTGFTGGTVEIVRGEGVRFRLIADANPPVRPFEGSLTMVGYRLDRVPDALEGEALSEASRLILAVARRRLMEELGYAFWGDHFYIGF